MAEKPHPLSHETRDYSFSKTQRSRRSVLRVLGISGLVGSILSTPVIAEESDRPERNNEQGSMLEFIDVSELQLELSSVGDALLLTVGNDTEISAITDDMAISRINDEIIIFSAANETIVKSKDDFVIAETDAAEAAYPAALTTIVPMGDETIDESDDNIRMQELQEEPYIIRGSDKNTIIIFPYPEEQILIDGLGRAAEAEVVPTLEEVASGSSPWDIIRDLIKCRLTRGEHPRDEPPEPPEPPEPEPPRADGVIYVRAIDCTFISCRDGSSVRVQGNISLEDAHAYC